MTKILNRQKKSFCNKLNKTRNDYTQLLHNLQYAQGVVCDLIDADDLLVLQDFEKIIYEKVLSLK